MTMDNSGNLILNPLQMFKSIDSKNSSQNAQLEGIIAISPPSPAATANIARYDATFVTHDSPTPSGACGKNTCNFNCIMQTPTCFGTLARGHFQISLTKQ